MTHNMCLVHFGLLKHSYTIFIVSTVFIVIIGVAAAVVGPQCRPNGDARVPLDFLYTREKEHNCSIIELYGE